MRSPPRRPRPRTSPDRLRDHPRHARGVVELRAELHRREPHRHRGGAERDRERADPSLRRRQPALTYTETGLVNGDTLTGALATTATATSSVGGSPYAITQGTLAASSNYALTYTGANLTVTAAALTVTANAQTRAYGAANPALTYTETGLVNGDTLTGPLATTATVDLERRRIAYAITQGTLAASTNYALSYTGANLTVTAAALSVTANAQTRPTAPPTDADLYRDRPGQRRHAHRCARHHGDRDLERRRIAYAITQGTLAASSNYTLSYTGANLTVTPAALTVTAECADQAYGAANPALTYTDTGLVNGDTLTGALATTATVDLECRRIALRHHPGHARGVCELHAELHRRQPHRHRGGADRDGERADARSTAPPIRR